MPEQNDDAAVMVFKAITGETLISIVIEENDEDECYGLHYPMSIMRTYDPDSGDVGICLTNWIDGADASTVIMPMAAIVTIVKPMQSIKVEYLRQITMIIEAEMEASADEVDEPVVDEEPKRSATILSLVQTDKSKLH